MAIPAGGQRVRFGAFEFDPAAGELYRDGQRVRLQDQPRQVLASLIGKPGEVVTRDELRERLWKTDTFVDFEHGLNTAIKKVRQALGDSADSPQFIETLAKRGYRFIAPVAASTAAAETPSPVLPVDVPAARSLSSGFLLIAFLAGVIALAAWLARSPRTATNPALGRPAQLAVMPLEVLGAAGEGATYLGVGIADAITTRLANVRQIALRPTSAVLRYRDDDSDPATVASALGVQHLLVGTIQRTADEYRVSVQLVRADGVAVWGRAYDVPRSGLLDLQDTVAEQVVSALQVELTGPERARLTARYTRNPEAYDLYLRGRTLLLNYTEVNMRSAIERFEQALAIDPAFSQARAALAMGCAWFSVRYAYESQASSWGKRAEEEARRALAQGAGLADAHLAIASAAGTLYRGFDWNTVIAESETALGLDPSLDLAHVARMRALYHLGRFDEARSEHARARALDPGPNVEAERLQIAMDLFSGRFKETADQAERLLARTDAPAVRHYLGLARFYLRDVDGARQMLASATRGGRPDVRSQASLASVEAASGLRSEGRARAEAIERGDYMDHHVAYSLGAAWAQIGDAAASVRWLQRAADSGFPCYPWYVQDTLLDPVRRDPAFTRLMSALEARYRAPARLQ
jgi:DNA-binding winged helix-turn-helix (wHTH) protein/TolB-like protein/tetratricopeptide (TPR) repeat protein